MIQPAIESIAKLAADRAELQAKLKDAKFIDDPNDPAHYYLLHDGVLTEMNTPPEPRNHTVSNLDSLIRLATRAKEMSEKPVLWHSLNGVVLVWSDEDRREQANWPLNQTELWTAICSVNNRPLNQADMIRVLRFQLADAISAPELLNTVRKIKFNRTNDASGEIKHGRESLGRSVEMEVTGAEAIPEDVLLHNVSIYDEVHYPLDLRFGLEINVSDEKFKLQAFAGVLPTAIRETQLELGRILTEALKTAGVEVPVFYGTP